MSNFRKDLELIVNHPRDDFIELSNLVGLSPESDFIGADMRGANLVGLDLRNYDFTNADFRGADIRDTQFNQKTLASARFSESTELGLVERGGQNKARKMPRGTYIDTIVQLIRLLSNSKSEEEYYGILEESYKVERRATVVKFIMASRTLEWQPNESIRGQLLSDIAIKNIYPIRRVDLISALITILGHKKWLKTYLEGYLSRSRSYFIRDLIKSYISGKPGRS